MHGVIVGGNSADHNIWSYKVRVTKMGRLTTHKAHLKDTNNDRTVPLRADCEGH